MSVVHDTFKLRHFICPDLHTHKEFWWGKNEPPLCPTCNLPTAEGEPARAQKAAYVIGDECDVMVRHGICNPDGTPKRYTSKEEMRRAAYEQGLTQGTDTPKPNQRIVEERARAREEGRPSRL
jgi:hypothetical protein